MCGGDTEIGFDEAYEYLKANSELLVRTKEGKTEVWETNGCLLTVVNLEKREFLTKRKQANHIKYNLAKQELLMVNERKEPIGEIWHLERINYKNQKFIRVGKLRVMYKAVRTWARKNDVCNGWTKAFIKAWKIGHRMEHETVIIANVEYF